MYDLFNPPPEGVGRLPEFRTSKLNSDFSAVKGCTYLPNYITSDDETSLLLAINSERWLSDIKRRVQHYGYKYDYRARTIDYSMYLGPLPSWSLHIAKRLHEENLIEEEPDQLIINEYLPGQGITNHIDCEPCFGETIISISLGSDVVMDFIHYKTKQKIEILLEHCSLIAISGEARHLWTHGIAHRSSDIIKGQKHYRNVRISMTFRKVLIRK